MSTKDKKHARMERIARRLVIGQLESTRDLEMSLDMGTDAITDLLSGDREDAMDVIWFLSFFAAAGAVADEIRDKSIPLESDSEEMFSAIQQAIETQRRRITYLSGIEENG